MNRILFFVAIIGVAFVLNACNTFYGLGEDMNAAGNAVKDAAN